MDGMTELQQKGFAQRTPAEKAIVWLWEIDGYESSACEAAAEIGKDKATIAAQAEQIAALKEALLYFSAKSDNSGAVDGEWQTYARNRWPNGWGFNEMQDADNEARALLAELK